VRRGVSRRHRDAKPVDFSAEDPVATIVELTGGIGTDRVIDKDRRMDYEEEARVEDTRPTHTRRRGRGHAE
jgi:hypothetical protein